MSKAFWRVGEDELRSIQEAFELGLHGEMNKRLEEEFCKRFDVNYAVGINSGTSALHAALYALGVRQGDEVIVTPLTFSAPTFAALCLGAVPVFADVDEKTFTMDPKSVEKLITGKTKAIVPVALYGLPADMEAIMAIAKKRNVGVVEDNAECFLGSIKGKLAGTFADISIFSFERSKHITTGNGGMMITSDEMLATKMRKFSILGYTTLSARQGQFKISMDTIQHPKFARHEMIGYNYRLPEVCAAMAVAQLQKIDMFVEKRCAIAKLYDEAVRGFDIVSPQVNPPTYKNSYWTYAFVLEGEKYGVTWEAFRRAFLDAGGERFYAAWLPTYLEPFFKNEPFLKRLGYGRGLCPVVEKVQPKIVQLKTNFQDLDYARRQADILHETVTKLQKH